MCFSIRKSAKRPLDRYAYKLVEITPDGTVQSLIMGKGLQTGENKRSRGPTKREDEYTPWPRARHGIYVYRTLREAKYQLKPHLRQRQQKYVNDGVIKFKRIDGSFSGYVAIIRVNVDPADWLHTSIDGKMATYKKVTIPERQPYITWTE